MGENDEFCKTLGDDTLAISDEGLRVCALCGKVRVSHVQPCTYCIASDRKRAVLFSGYLLLLVVAAFGLSMTVSAYDSRVTDAPEQNTDVVDQAVLGLVPVWGDQFIQTECAICPECCGEDQEDAEPEDDSTTTEDIDP